MMTQTLTVNIALSKMAITRVMWHSCHRTSSRRTGSKTSSPVSNNNIVNNELNVINDMIVLH